MNPKLERDLIVTRRPVLWDALQLAIGTAALSHLMHADGYSATQPIGLPGVPHFAPKAKRVIYMFQSGAPSQIDMFDYKPMLEKFHGQDLPDSVRKGQRITGMTSGQSSLPIASSIFKFQKHGQSGTALSELLPYTAKVVDDLAFVKTVAYRRNQP